MGRENAIASALRAKFFRGSLAVEPRVSALFAPPAMVGAIIRGGDGRFLGFLRLPGVNALTLDILKFRRAHL